MNESLQARIERFQNKIHSQIPLTQHMGFERVDYDGRDLCFHLSLASNHNDKGTAFAGALSAAANLCGWGSIWLLLETEPQDYDVVIRDSRLEYSLPVTRDFQVQARMPEQQQIDLFLEKLRDKGKARLDLQVSVEEDGQLCFQFSGAYVALKKKQWL